MRLDEAEAAELARRAEKAGVSAPRFLVEAALVGDRQTVSERRALIGALMAAKRSASGADRNLNQLARVANATGEIPAELGAALAAVVELGGRLAAAAERLASPGSGPGPGS